MAFNAKFFDFLYAPYTGSIVSQIENMISSGKKINTNPTQLDHLINMSFIVSTDSPVRSRHQYTPPGSPAAFHTT
jgi:hypothetical protein